jgi:hypothetical protein
MRGEIRPTHTCFDDALEFFAERLKAKPALAKANGFVLVHGVLLAPSGPHEGEPFAHAWVEEAGEVWNSGLLEGQLIYYAVDRDEWYREMRLQDSTRYSPRAAWEANERSGHNGPWEERYRALCGGGEPRVLGALQGRSA